MRYRPRRAEKSEASHDCGVLSCEVHRDDGAERVSDDNDLRKFVSLAPQ